MENDFEKIIDFGGFLYDAEKMAAILERPVSEIRALMADKESEFYKLYQRGSALADYVLDKKLMQLASQGDLKCIEQIKVDRRIRQKK